MNKILEIDEASVSSPSISIDHPFERPVTRAKIMGPLCVGFAAISMVFGIISPYFYFAFLLTSAIFGLLAYTEVSVKKKGTISSVALLMSVVLIVMLLLSFPLSLNSWNFRLFYGLLSVLVPILLTLVANHQVGVNLWKTLVPLLLPVFFIGSLISASMNMFSVTFLLLPIGWGLIGVAAFLGNGEKR